VYLKKIRLGFALCGSFCTHAAVLREMKVLCDTYDVFPILSSVSVVTDTRFGPAVELIRALEEMTGNSVIHTVEQAEPIGPKALLDVLVVAPCTGNTAAKLAHGITDGPVTMAVKAHLRNGRPVVIAIASNDGLSAGAKNLGELLNRKNYFFVPFGQDDAEGKPCSLMADFGRIGETVEAALAGKQVQPVLL